MRGLNDTIKRLSALRRVNEAYDGGSASDLQDLNAFGSNPGKLGAFVHVPENLPSGAPLVVVLHGCAQNAAGYDRGSGWSELADRHGFAVLYPEQRRTNNPNLCFNWYAPADARRGRGEALSIRQMIAKLVETYKLDPARIFANGLSAGGAMTSVMLATYPELFAGGAIIAGLPFGTAKSVSQALDRMRGHGGPGDDRLAALVAGASKHDGPWPTLSVWHGRSDAIVDPANADSIVEQWRPLHGVDSAPTTVEIVDGHQRRAWRDADGREVIEQYRVAGMGHGTPLDTIGTGGVGTAGPHMLEVGISSTRHIAGFWGLTSEAASKPAARPAKVAAEPRPAAVAASPDLSRSAAMAAPPDVPRRRPVSRAAKPAVTKIIEDALRAAGLMR